MNNNIALQNGYMSLEGLKEWIGKPVFYDEENEEYVGGWYIIESVSKSNVREYENLWIIKMDNGFYFEWYDNFSENSRRNPRFRRPITVSETVHYCDNWV